MSDGPWFPFPLATEIHPHLIADLIGDGWIFTSTPVDLSVSEPPNRQARPTARAADVSPLSSGERLVGGARLFILSSR